MHKRRVSACTGVDDAGKADDAQPVLNRRGSYLQTVSNALCHDDDRVEIYLYFRTLAKGFLGTFLFWAVIGAALTYTIAGYDKLEDHVSIFYQKFNPCIFFDWYPANMWVMLPFTWMILYDTCYLLLFVATVWLSGDFGLMLRTSIAVLPAAITAFCFINVFVTNLYINDPAGKHHQSGSLTDAQLADTALHTYWWLLWCIGKVCDVLVHMALLRKMHGGKMPTPKFIFLLLCVPIVTFNAVRIYITLSNGILWHDLPEQTFLMRVTYYVVVATSSASWYWAFIATYRFSIPNTEGIKLTFWLKKQEDAEDHAFCWLPTWCCASRVRPVEDEAEGADIAMDDLENNEAVIPAKAVERCDSTLADFRARASSISPERLFSYTYSAMLPVALTAYLFTDPEPNDSLISGFRDQPYSLIFAPCFVFVIAVIALLVVAIAIRASLQGRHEKFPHIGQHRWVWVAASGLSYFLTCCMCLWITIPQFQGTTWLAGLFVTTTALWVLSQHMPGFKSPGNVLKESFSVWLYLWAVLLVVAAGLSWVHVVGNTVAYFIMLCLPILTRSVTTAQRLSYKLEVVTAGPEKLRGIANTGCFQYMKEGPCRLLKYIGSFPAGVRHFFLQWTQCFRNENLIVLCQRQESVCLPAGAALAVGPGATAADASASIVASEAADTLSKEQESDQEQEEVREQETHEQREDEVQEPAQQAREPETED